MRRKRPVGNRVWMGLLGFCLFVCVVLDGLFLYLLAIRWAQWRQMLTLLCAGYLLTRATYQLLRRRIAITGADKFPGF